MPTSIYLPYWKAFSDRRSGWLRGLVPQAAMRRAWQNRLRRRQMDASVAGRESFLLPKGEAKLRYQRVEFRRFCVVG